MTPKQAITFLNKGKDKSGIIRFPDVYNYLDGVCTLNGHVVHIWKGEYTGEVKELERDLSVLFKGDPITSFVVTKEHIRRATKACKAFKPVSMTVSVNGSLYLQAKSYDGNTRAIIDNGMTWYTGKRNKEHRALYSMVGSECSFSIDPKYLWNAIMAMGDILIVSIFEHGMIKVQCEDTEAWIMTMLPGVEHN